MLYNLLKSSFFASCALLASQAWAGAIQDLTDEDNAQLLMSQYDYTVVSFYNSEPEALEIDGLMEGAKSFIDQ